MAIAYFDTIAGISGDMTLGAFISAGVPLDFLRRELEKLPLRGFELSVSHIERSGIVATAVEVMVSEEPQPHRHLSDINEMITQSTLSQSVRKRAESIFLEIARAEAKVHNTTIEDIHFHEVGAVDSLVDIIGAAICLEYFEVDTVYSSPVKLGGGGWVRAEHGTLPVPTPATVEILRGYPTVLTEIQSELTTPTGAAIIKALSRGMLSTEQLKTLSIGYGAGKRELKEVPNLLRVFIGELNHGFESDNVVEIETNIDDMNPEIYPYVIERLLSVGAHDAYLIPILMKKGRPGMLLSTLVERSKLDVVLSILFHETTTLGVRIKQIERKKLARVEKVLETTFGPTRVKAIILEGREHFVPEFEECKRIAQEQKMPLKDVYRILEKELRT